MPSWILPGRENAATTRYKAILEKSFAFSRTFNPRNLEYHCCATQYPVWFIPKNDEETEGDEGHDVGNDPEEMEVNIGGSRSTESTLLDDDESYDESVDVSFASTMPEKYAKSVVVDFAIINLRGVPLKKQRVRYGGWRITQADVGLIVEVKRFASRGLTGVELEKELQGRITEAHEDLINQAAHLFLQDEQKDFVVAIAATGPYWCSTKIYRRDVRWSMHLLEESDPTYQAHTNHLRTQETQLKWSSLLRLDLARSNDRWHTIYKDLVESGVLETPGNV